MIYSRRIIDSKQSMGASFNIKAKARELRKSMTVAEKILWKQLRNRKLNGMHFRRQHPYNIYILDFYCFEAKLAIEIDGDIHLNQKEYDKERTEFLESTGLEVIRFTNKDIESRIDWVIEVIKDHVNRNFNTFKSLIGTI
jgi:5-methyltetrahydrofolate--homocysteine methyltransferase/ATP-dependent helicase HrpA